MNTSVSSQTALSDAVHIVLNAMPEPDEMTSWDRIIEFRKDPDTEHKRLGLRHWMRKVAQGNYSTAEVSDELAWLLSDYEAYLRLHEMKVNIGALETVLTAAGEVAEDLVKLKLSKLAKLPFVLKHRKLALLEAEITAPGREVAYIVKARHEFRRNEAKV